MINQLQIISENLLNNVNFQFKRDFYDEFNLEKFGPTAVIGERGVGKTYFILQKLKESNLKIFYFSADNMLLKGKNLFDVAFDLVENYGIEFIAIDEIHKMEDWQKDLKSIIDSFPNLKIIVSGSSSLDLYKKTADLQRRIYNFPISTLNFKEFLKFYKNKEIKKFSFEEIISDYKKISFELGKKGVLEDFKEYLNYGFYPYSKEKKEIYHSILLKNIQKIILEDIPSFLNFNTSTLSKIEKLFFYISNTHPSDLNYNSLGKKLDISKDLLETIVIYLDKIGVLNMAVRSNKLTDIVRKEFKIFLGNPNIYYAYLENPEIGSVRESFMLKVFKNINLKNHFNEDIILPNYGDLIFDYKGKKYIFEIGGKNKTSKQIKLIENSFVISDDILIGEGNKIPMWLFGLI